MWKESFHIIEPARKIQKEIYDLQRKDNHKKCTLKKKTSNAKVNINGCFDQYLYWYLCMPTKTYYCYCTCTQWGTHISDAVLLSFFDLTNRDLWGLSAHLHGILENWHCDNITMPNVIYNSISAMVLSAIFTLQL